MWNDLKTIAQKGFTKQADGTYFAFAVGSMSYEFIAPEIGARKFIVTAKKGVNAVPEGYAFLLNVFVDGIKQKTISLPASSAPQSTEFELDIKRAGTQTIELDWTNDVYLAGSYDANLCIYSLGADTVLVNSAPMVSAKGNGTIDETKNDKEEAPLVDLKPAPNPPAFTPESSAPASIGTDVSNTVSTFIGDAQTKIASVLPDVPMWAKVAVLVALGAYIVSVVMKKKG